jgi:serine/threonine-protein phosphatase 2A activator
MIKMYNAEVLSKFPVVQHFPFGSLFKWEQDPQAIHAPPSAHTSSQPLRSAPATLQESNASLGRTTAQIPQPSHDVSQMPQTSAPWAKLPSAAPISTRTSSPRRGMEPPTRAPWADRGTSASTAGNLGGTAQTRAP